MINLCDITLSHFLHSIHLPLCISGIRNPLLSDFISMQCIGQIIREGGVAYGVFLNEEHYAVYGRIEEEEKKDIFRGSKYTGSLWVIYI